MRVMFKTIIVMFFAFFIFITQANENVSDDKNLIVIVKQYYKAIEDVRHENSKESDVKKLVQLLSDDFKYEHPRFGAYGNRQEKQQGLTFVLGKQRSSKIKDGKISRIRVLVAQ
jgi:uncharacterized protein (UPF0371 family)